MEAVETVVEVLVRAVEVLFLLVGVFIVVALFVSTFWGPPR